MNEQIKQFVEHAGGYYLPPNIPLNKPAHIFLEDEQVEKFYELIVQECISAVEDTNDRHRKDYFADKIKKHFGVE